MCNKGSESFFYTRHINVAFSCTYFHSEFVFHQRLNRNFPRKQSGKNNRQFSKNQFQFKKLVSLLSLYPCTAITILISISNVYIVFHDDSKNSVFKLILLRHDIYPVGPGRIIARRGKNLWVEALQQWVRSSTR